MPFRLAPVTRHTPLSLDDDAARVSDAPSKDKLKRALEKSVARIAELQKILIADGRFALLVILQGRDASGKDGTIKRVFRDVDPQGIVASAFEAPGGPELAHDYLWRVHQRVPPRGVIGVFNRSHYEDVLVPRVHGTIARGEWERRYRQINDFERMLVENGTVVLKFFLHMSRDEQRKQLAERLEDPTKNWKFREGDLDDRRAWDAYTEAYRDAIRACSTTWAPWYVVPADDKRVRNVLVAHTVATRLAKLKLEYPRAAERVRRLEID